MKATKRRKHKEIKHCHKRVEKLCKNWSRLCVNNKYKMYHRFKNNIEYIFFADYNSSVCTDHGCYFRFSGRRIFLRNREFPFLPFFD